MPSVCDFDDVLVRFLIKRTERRSHPLILHQVAADYQHMNNLSIDVKIIEGRILEILEKLHRLDFDILKKVRMLFVLRGQVSQGMYDEIAKFTQFKYILNNNERISSFDSGDGIVVLNIKRTPKDDLQNKSPTKIQRSLGVSVDQNFPTAALSGFNNEQKGQTPLFSARTLHNSSIQHESLSLFPEITIIDVPPPEDVIVLKFAEGLRQFAGLCYFKDLEVQASGMTKAKEFLNRGILLFDFTSTIKAVLLNIENARIPSCPEASLRTEEFYNFMRITVIRQVGEEMLKELNEVIEKKLDLLRGQKDKSVIPMGIIRQNFEFLLRFCSAFGRL